MSVALEQNQKQVNNKKVDIFMVGLAHPYMIAEYCVDYTAKYVIGSDKRYHLIFF